jgi:hypothetical protein
MGILRTILEALFGRKLAELARILGFTGKEQRLSEWPVSYRSFTIPKRRGGTRTIQAPADDLKKLQRAILHKVLISTPVHRCATAYVSGRSIVENARPHVGAAVVVTMDLEDFFGSTTAKRVEQYLRHAGWSPKAARVLTRLTTFQGSLPQGAPTSPKLSNLVNYLLDARLDAYARAAGGAYTRYSDDLTFSFPREPRSLHGFRRRVRAILKEHGYKLQEKKRVQIRRPHQPQLVTGLVVNRKVHTPRHLRRLVRAMEHRLRVGRKITMEPKRFEGLRAYLKMVTADRAP